MIEVHVRRSYGRWYFTLVVNSKTLPITSRAFSSRHRAEMAAMDVLGAIAAVAYCKGQVTFYEDNTHHTLDPMLGREFVTSS